MIVIVGESGAGKTSLQDELTTVFDWKFHKLVTFTTRPPRDLEVDGKDYHFVSEEEFERLKNTGFFLETAQYRGWSYGCPKYSSKNKDPIKDTDIVVLTPSGLRAARRENMKVFSIYIKVDRRSRLIRLLKRGDDIEEAYRRSLSDIGQFDGIEDEVDLVIDNPSYKLDIYDIVEIVMSAIKLNNMERSD